MQIHRCGPKALFVVLAVALLGGVVAAEPAPKQIGTLQPASIVTPSPYPVSFGENAREFEVRFDGATYIRVHFTNFDLAPGDSVEVFDPDGRRFQTYTGRGIHGTGDFWAHTVPGDTAIVRMQATVGGDSGFEIDSFGAGFEPIFGEDPVDPGTDSVCGSQDWEDVECYSGSTLFDKSRAVVKAIIGCCSSCTAWKMSDGGQFMYNEHCGATQNDVQNTELLQDYKNNACGGGGSGNGPSAFGSQLLASDYTLDYTMMQATGDFTGIPCLSFAPRQAAIGDRIYIAHHPSGGVKKLSVNSDHPSNPNGWCEVDDNAHTGRGAGTDIGYYCDTIGGSSGSPILDYATHEVIALHHFGGCLNSGGRSDLILDDIQAKGVTIGTCSDSGGEPGVCGNGTIEWPEECDGGNLGGASCESLGYKRGTLACNADCTLETSDCKGGGGGGGNDPGTCAAYNEPCRKDTDCCAGFCLGQGKNKVCR